MTEKIIIATEGYVYFSLGSFILTEVDFLHWLGMEPDAFHISGKGVGKPRLNWKITTRRTINPDLPEMIEHIVDRLIPIKDRLIAFKRAYPDLNCQFQIVFWLGTEYVPALTIENDTLLFLGEIGAVLDCDMYNRV